MIENSDKYQKNGKRIKSRTGATIAEILEVQGNVTHVHFGSPRTREPEAPRHYGGPALRGFAPHGQAKARPVRRMSEPALRRERRRRRAARLRTRTSREQTTFARPVQAPVTPMAPPPQEDVESEHHAQASPQPPPGRLRRKKGPAVAVLSPRERDTLMDILYVSQLHGYAFGDYGWWRRLAEKKQHLVVADSEDRRLTSMWTRTGTPVSDREFRRTLLHLELKGFLIRLYPEPNQRIMYATPAGLAALRTIGCGGYVDNLTRKDYGYDGAHETPREGGGTQKPAADLRPQGQKGGAFSRPTYKRVGGKVGGKRPAPQGEQAGDFAPPRTKSDPRINTDVQIARERIPRGNGGARGCGVANGVPLPVSSLRDDALAAVAQAASHEPLLSPPQPRAVPVPAAVAMPPTCRTPAPPAEPDPEPVRKPPPGAPGTPEGDASEQGPTTTCVH